MCHMHAIITRFPATEQMPFLAIREKQVCDIHILKLTFINFAIR